MRTLVPASSALVVCFLISTPLSADDAAVKFGIFLGAVKAIESKCEKYFVRTDAVMGGHLSQADYEYAQSMIDREVEKSLSALSVMSCHEAAIEAAKLTNKSFFEVWEIQ